MKINKNAENWNRKATKQWEKWQIEENLNGRR